MTVTPAPTGKLNPSMVTRVPTGPLVGVTVRPGVMLTGTALYATPGATPTPAPSLTVMAPATVSVKVAVKVPSGLTVAAAGAKTVPSRSKSTDKPAV